MSDYVTLMVCCNDHRNGMFTGRIDALDLCWPGGLMAISLYLAVVDAPARVAFGQGFIKISRRRFASRGYGEWVGNWCWNAVSVTPEVAADVLNYVRALHCREHRKYEVESAPAVWFDRWKSGEAFTAAMLREVG